MTSVPRETRETLGESETNMINRKQTDDDEEKHIYEVNGTGDKRMNEDD